MKLTRARPPGELSPAEVKKVLTAEKIQEFREPIVAMGRDKLHKHFGWKTTSGINVSLLIKNMIWQVHQDIRAGKAGPFTGNIRSMWYSHIKPTLSRAGGLSSKSDPYEVMINMFVRLVMLRNLVSYQTFGFADENRELRQIGGKNGHILLVAEKRGHYALLQKIAEFFDVTVISLGGQPSLLSTENFVREFKAAGFDLDGDYAVLTFVDYDPSGDSIVETFLRQLEEFGLKKPERTDLVKPQNLSESQVRLNKFRLPRAKREKQKNARWVAKTGGVNGDLYGLEADAMSEAQMIEVFTREVERYLKIGVIEVRRRRMKRQLVKLLQRKILQKAGAGG
jgi:hypothetical protein